jgi:hypothetical protein
MVLGSFLSAFLGWTVLNLYSLSTANFDSTQGGEGWAGVAVMGIFSGILILGTWFVALLPLYVLVPSRSVLRKWPICTLCGVVSGAIIMLIFGMITSPSTVPWHQYVPYCTFAAVVGGITCLFGSLTRRFFRGE